MICCVAFSGTFIRRFPRPISCHPSFLSALLLVEVVLLPSLFSRFVYFKRYQLHWSNIRFLHENKPKIKLVKLANYLRADGSSIVILSCLCLSIVFRSARVPLFTRMSMKVFIFGWSKGCVPLQSSPPIVSL